MELIFKEEDSQFLAHLRALSIFVIVFGHVGGFWIFGPSSKFLLVFLAFFFFISGVVSFVSLERYPSLPKWIFRRFLSLYVPYLLFCLVPLGVYIFLYRSLPHFSLKSFFDWLKMYPASSYKIYPLGHLWFLQTLMIITVLFAPLMFSFFKRFYFAPWLCFGALTFLATLKFLGLIVRDFSLCGISFYKPIVYSFFYVLAWFFLFDRSTFCGARFLLLNFLLFFFCLAFLLFKRQTFYFEGHIHPPDIYFVSVSTLCIILLVRIQRWFNLFFSLPLLHVFSKFFFEHTYSIYLLHTFAIFLSETAFGFLLPSTKNFFYGIIKLSVVLLLTSVFALFFDFFAKKLTKRFLIYLGG